jgi:shikimate 5-dehydrogenase
MMEAAYTHHGIDARYINCEVAAENLADAVHGATAMGWIGFNCSLPHKVAVIELLDELAESARLIGAVNCAVRRDGRWIGGEHRWSGLSRFIAHSCRTGGQAGFSFSARRCGSCNSSRAGARRSS